MSHPSHERCEPDIGFRPGLPSLDVVQAHHDAQVRAHPELGGLARGYWMLRSRVLEPVQIYLRVETGKVYVGLHTLMETWDPGPDVEVRPCDRDSTPVPWPVVTRTPSGASNA